MPYGPQTTEIIAKLNSGPKYEDFSKTEPDEFCLSFADRLFDFVSEYAELPSERDKCRKAFAALVNTGSAARGFSFSKATLSQWLSGDRDPSVTGGETQTRANIYKLCSALDYDFELSCEFFEKVFFTRPFNPKNLTELAYMYFASQDAEDGIFDGSWYTKAQDFLVSLPDDKTSQVPAPMETRRILSDIRDLDIEEFREYIIENRACFSPDNEYASAIEAVKQYALKCCKLCDTLDYSEGDPIPYDTLISAILGYSQRSVQGASVPVSALKNLPSQLTANFPTGPILNKICAGSENSYDKIYKMLCLLLFYYFFSMDTNPDKGKTDFKAFLSYANRELGAVNLPELYPRQPYGGFILHCAASSDPLEEIGRFLSKKAREQSESSLVFLLSDAAPMADAETLKKTVAGLGYMPWAVTLTANTAKAYAEDFSFSDFAGEFDSENEYGDYSGILEYLFSFCGDSEEHRSLMRLASLIPGEGLREDVFYALAGDKESAEKIIALGWIDKKAGRLFVRSEVRGFVNDSEWFPRWGNCGIFAERFTGLCCYASGSGLSLKELSPLAGKLSHLDGIPPEKKLEIKGCLKI